MWALTPLSPPRKDIKFSCDGMHPSKMHPKISPMASDHFEYEDSNEDFLSS